MKNFASFFVFIVVALQWSGIEAKDNSGIQPALSGNDVPKAQLAEKPPARHVDSDNIYNPKQNEDAIEFFEKRLDFKLDNKVHFIQPSKHRLVLSGSDMDTIIYASNYDKLPENMTVAMYREVPWEDNLIAYKSFKKDDLVKISNDLENYYALPYDFSQTRTVDSEYYLALTTTEWFGQKDIAVSDQFRVVKQGAQPDVKTEQQYVESVTIGSSSEEEESSLISTTESSNDSLKLEDTVTFKCNKLPVSIKLNMKPEQDLKLSVLNLANGKSREVLEIDDSEFAEGESVFEKVIEYKGSESGDGPYLLEVAVDGKLSDKVIYRSSSFYCD